MRLALVVLSPRRWRYFVTKWRNIAAERTWSGVKPTDSAPEQVVRGHGCADELDDLGTVAKTLQSPGSIRVHQRLEESAPHRSLARDAQFASQRFRLRQRGHGAAGATGNE